MVLNTNLDVDSNIKESISVFERVSNLYKFDKGYIHCNENVPFLLDKLNINKKGILSVASSGEHLLCFLTKNPKFIDTFDCNSFAYYMMNLRLASKRVLSIEEDEKFFPSVFTKKENAHDKLNIKSYSKVRDALSSDSRYFWDSMYSYLKRVEYPMDTICLLTRNECESYDTYLFLKEHDSEIKKGLDNVDISFEKKDVLSLYNSSRIAKYGTIYLSNIYDWIKNSNRIDIKLIKKNIFKSVVSKKYPNMLLSYGTLMGYYNAHEDVDNFDKFNTYKFDAISNVNCYDESPCRLCRHSVKILINK